MSDAAAGASLPVIPDPFNQVEVNRWMIAHIAALEQEREGRRINATQAALELGYSESFFRGHPWRIPGFGITGTLHSLAAWRSWNERPEIDRKLEWDNMPLDQRRKARGIA